MPIPTLPRAQRVKAWDGAWFVIIGGVDLGLVEYRPISRKWEAIVNRELAPHGLRSDQRSLGRFDKMSEAVAELRIQFGQAAMDTYRDDPEHRKSALAQAGGIP